MKFLHLADLHIGKNLNSYSLLVDQEYILNQILEIGKSNNVKYLFLSGDVYDRSVPSGDAVKVFNDFLIKAIKEYQYKVYVIVGNHDSAERLNFVSDLLKDENLYISSYPNLPLTKYEVKDEYGDVYIYMLPYSTPLYAKVKEKADVSNYTEMVKYYLDNSQIDYSKRNILLTHHTILHQSQCIKSDSEYNVMIGGSEGFEATLLKDFDYVACGHLHVNQYVGFNHIRYSGSILKYSASEIGRDKVVVIGELKEKGDLTITEIPLKPLHDVKEIKGDFNDLIKDIEVKDEDYIYFKLTNHSVITNGMQILKTKYPNAVGLEYVELEKLSNDISKIDQNYKTLKPNEQFKIFYEEMTGTPLNEYQEDIINQVSSKEEA